MENHVLDICNIDATSTEECLKLYSELYAEFDEYNKQTNYKGVDEVVQAVTEFSPPVPRNSKILDVCAGTGCMGAMLKLQGFENIDALDGCKEMLQEAIKKGIYNETILSVIQTDAKLPIADGTYDMITASGTFAPGYLYTDHIPVLLQVLKPGGLMVFARRDGYQETSPRFMKFDDDIQEFQDKGLCELVLRKKIPVYRKNYAGHVYILKKL